jgi:aminoglycoside phosphotransferase family enzyme
MKNPDAQQAVIRFLSDPASHGGMPVKRIDTHISHIFLVGERAYKLKRAVTYDFVDFSSLAARQVACEAEVVLNRRTAPQLYLACVPVTRSRAGFAIDGTGPAVDWLVVMKRFADDALLGDIARAGQLSPAIIDRLGDAVARFHRSAQIRRDKGGAPAMRQTFKAVFGSLERASSKLFDGAMLARLQSDFLALLEALAPRLDARRRHGFVRHCHGDLHLANICLIDDEPVPFDCIEFSDDLACIDLMYDLAFLVMDLLRLDLADLANRVMNRYLSLTRDYSGLTLMPLCLSGRALVRAMVGALEGDEPKARAYLALASHLLTRAPARLIAIGGLSGSGKSTTARAIAARVAPGAGAVVLSSDVIRKRLYGVAPEARLEPAAYAPDVSKRVYRRLEHDARRALAAGQTVIADATFTHPAARARLETLARTCSVAFTGIWLDAPEKVLAERIRARRGDVSDADLAVLASQLKTGVGPLTWRRIATCGDADDQVLALLGPPET